MMKTAKGIYYVVELLELDQERVEYLKEMNLLKEEKKFNVTIIYNKWTFLIELNLPLGAYLETKIHRLSEYRYFIKYNEFISFAQPNFP